MTDVLEGYAARLDWRLPRPADGEGLHGLVAAFLQEVAVSSMEAGALVIGHIKCYVETEHGELIYGSSVAATIRPSIKGDIQRPAENVSVVLNVLVMGLKQSQVAAAVEDASRRFSAESGVLAVLEPVTSPPHDHDGHDGHAHEEHA